MTTNEEIHDALMVIDSRLRTLDGKVNLVARANREALLTDLAKIVAAKPIVGQLYLLLDGVKNQEEITADLVANGVQTSKSAVSRWLVDMHGEHGLVERVPTTGPGKTYRKNQELERALNLTRKIEKWLAEAAKAKSSPGEKKQKN